MVISTSVADSRSSLPDRLSAEITLMILISEVMLSSLRMLQRKKRTTSLISISEGMQETRALRKKQKKRSQQEAI